MPGCRCGWPIWHGEGGHQQAPVDSSNLRHLSRRGIGGTLFLACHTDMMIPFVLGFFVAGFRAQWKYSWSYILQKQNNSHIEDINFLVTVGFEF